jgi:hypothetical protein
MNLHKKKSASDHDSSQLLKRTSNHKRVVSKRISINLLLIAGLAIFMPSYGAIAFGQGGDVDALQAFSEAMNSAQIELSNTAAKDSEQYLAALKGMELLMSSLPAAEKEKPLIERFSPDQAFRFGELHQQEKVGTMLMLMNSKRQRDLDILRKMFRTIDDMLRWGKKIDEKSPELIFMKFLFALEVTDPDAEKSSQLVKARTATPIVNAIQLTQKTSEKYLEENSSRLESGAKDANALIAKYNTKNADEMRLKSTDSEKLAHDKFRREYQIYMSHVTHIKRLEHLKAISLIMDESYKLNREHTLTSFGNIDAMNNAVSEHTGEHFTEYEKTVLGVTYALNEEIPAKMIKDWDDVKERVNSPDAK